MSFVELLTALAVLMLVTSVAVARLNYRAELNRTHCAHGLKEATLAFRQFANDNADLYPAQVALALGGAREAVLEGRIETVFQVLADYQVQPIHLICPGDDRAEADAVAQLAARNLSYFVNRAAQATGSREVLIGDRDLKLVAADASEANWLKGTHALQSGEALEWSGARHRDAGNLALTDGSVRVVSSVALPTMFQPGAELLFPR